MRMIKVRIGWSDGDYWIHRELDPETPVDATRGITEVPEVILQQFELWRDEGVFWSRWLRNVDDAVLTEADKTK